MTSSPSRGIYILGNDTVLDDALALVNSLRRYAPDYPIVLIPYDQNYLRLARRLNKEHGVGVLADPHLFALLEEHALAIHGEKSPAFRKFTCWFGPFDEFIYFDTDIVVFQDQIDVFRLLCDHDIVYCGDGRTLGIQEVFTDRVIERRLFSPQEIDDLFNTGFFASRKTALDQDQLLGLLREAALVSDIFLPYTQEQPVLNYVVLRAFPRRANLRSFQPAIPDDAWAGNPNLQVNGDKMTKSNGMPVRYLHWASRKQMPDRPYIDLWLRYRYPGIRGVPQRWIIGTFRLGQRIIRRGLCTHMTGWYKPSFQLERARRILAQRVVHPLGRFLLPGRR